MDLKKFGYVLGQILAVTTFSCIVACLCGLAIALSVKFLTLIF